MYIVWQISKVSLYESMNMNIRAWIMERSEVIPLSQSNFLIIFGLSDFKMVSKALNKQLKMITVCSVCRMLVTMEILPKSKRHNTCLLSIHAYYMTLTFPPPPLLYSNEYSIWKQFFIIFLRQTFCNQFHLIVWPFDSFIQMMVGDRSKYCLNPLEKNILIDN